MQLEPYLYFNGKCEEALHFYAKVFGGEIADLNRFSDSPMDEHMTPEQKTKIMHSTFAAPSVKFMASDGMPDSERTEGERTEGNRVAMSLSTQDVAEAERVFKGLGEGGTVTMPLADTFWGAKFGTLTDKYGIDWMVNCRLQR